VGATLRRVRRRRRVVRRRYGDVQGKGPDAARSRRSRGTRLRATRDANDRSPAGVLPFRSKTPGWPRAAKRPASARSAYRALSNPTTAGARVTISPRPSLPLVLRGARRSARCRRAGDLLGCRPRSRDPERVGRPSARRRDRPLTRRVTRGRGAPASAFSGVSTLALFAGDHSGCGRRRSPSGSSVARCPPGAETRDDNRIVVLNFRRLLAVIAPPAARAEGSPPVNRRPYWCGQPRTVIGSPRDRKKPSGFFSEIVIGGYPTAGQPPGPGRMGASSGGNTRPGSSAALSCDNLTLRRPSLLPANASCL